MPEFERWTRDTTAIDVTARAVGAWNRILRDAVTITVVRNGVTQAEQTVRIEADSVARVTVTDAGRTGAIRRVIFGVRDHPAIADIDLLRGDRFAVAGVQYEITQVLLLPGELQAIAESVT